MSDDKDNDSLLFETVQRYAQQTHAPTHDQYTLEIVDVFAVERSGESERFASSLANRTLLWHGSRLSNWAGILKGGLRIAPPEAPSTGYMFGKGVYFADSSSKSANYCFCTADAPEGVLTLCEVALGDPYHRTAAEYEAAASCKRAGKHHTFGQGKSTPDPAGTRPLPSESEVAVPCGKLKHSGVKNTSLLYNEYIVYDERQVRLRFVVRVKFHFR